VREGSRGSAGGRLGPLAEAGTQVLLEGDDLGVSFSASIEGLAVGNAPASFVRGCDVAPVNRE
jgi:hypothetical protein